MELYWLIKVTARVRGKEREWRCLRECLSVASADIKRMLEHTLEHTVDSGLHAGFLDDVQAEDPLLFTQ